MEDQSNWDLATEQRANPRDASSGTGSLKNKKGHKALKLYNLTPHYACIYHTLILHPKHLQRNLHALPISVMHRKHRNQCADTAQ